MHKTAVSEILFPFQSEAIDDSSGHNQRPSKAFRFCNALLTSLLAATLQTTLAKVTALHVGAAYC